MYLSNLLIRHPYEPALRWLANPYRVHQRLLMAWPDGGSQTDTQRMLFRVDSPASDREAIRITVQAPLPANWEAAFADLPILASPPLQEPFDPLLSEAQEWAFRLRANPTKRTREGRRIDLNEPASQLDWLERKAAAAGFEITQATIAGRGWVFGGKPEHDMAWHGVDFAGHLLVLDPVALGAALERGIGSAKGFGFGLLSLAPP